MAFCDRFQSLTFRKITLWRVFSVRRQELFRMIRIPPSAMYDPMDVFPMDESLTNSWMSSVGNSYKKMFIPRMIVSSFNWIFADLSLFKINYYRSYIVYYRCIVSLMHFGRNKLNLYELKPEKKKMKVHGFLVLRFFPEVSHCSVNEIH